MQNVNNKLGCVAREAGCMVAIDDKGFAGEHRDGIQEVLTKDMGMYISKDIFLTRVNCLREQAN